MIFEEKKPKELKPEEIFAEPTEPIKPTEPAKITHPKEFIRKKRGLPKIFIFIIILIVLVGSVFLFSYLKVIQLQLKQKENPPLNQPTIVPPSTPSISPIIDSDGDGLTDEEEKILGTNINSPDSDNDGLFDREEVKIYQTNPLNPDTDGDGYLDGQELKAGYDPKNPSPQAKILDLKKEIEKLQ